MDAAVSLMSTSPLARTVTPRVARCASHPGKPERSARCVAQGVEYEGPFSAQLGGLMLCLGRSRITTVTGAAPLGRPPPSTTPATAMTRPDAHRPPRAGTETAGADCL